MTEQDEQYKLEISDYVLLDFIDILVHKARDFDADCKVIFYIFPIFSSITIIFRFYYFILCFMKYIIAYKSVVRTFKNYIRNLCIDMVV